MIADDSSGNPELEEDFYPYGGIAYTSGSDPNNYKFTGKERDSESMLDNFGARYYTSNIGRFLTPDWAAKPTTVPYAKFGDPQTLNLYAYVENGPINKIDPDGHLIFGFVSGQYSTLGPGQILPTVDGGTLVSNNSSAPPLAQNAGQISLTLGDTQVKGNYSFGPTGDTWERPVNGAIIEATPSGCASCSWVQTVSATGAGSHAEHTDAYTPGTPTYSQSSKNPSAFYDRPGRQQGDAGASTFTTILGKANATKSTFHAKGAMTWGYSVDQHGKVTGSTPRLATKGELQRALGVVQHDFPFWKID